MFALAAASLSSSTENSNGTAETAHPLVPMQCRAKLPSMVVQKSPAFLLAAALFFVPNLSRGALIIDQFLFSQSVTSTAGSATASSSATPGGLFMDTASNSSVASADREFFVDRVSGPSGGRVASLTSSGGSLVLNTDPEPPSNPRGQGLGSIVYESQLSGDGVINSFAANPNVYTLDLNLLSYGNQVEILGRGVGAAGGGTVPVYLTLYGSGAQSGQTATAQFNLTSTDTVITKLFSEFTGNTAILTNIGAIRLSIGNVPGESSPDGTLADVSLDYLAVTGTPTTPPAVPEPATMGLLGSALTGLVMVHRRRAGKKSGR